MGISVVGEVDESLSHLDIDLLLEADFAEERAHVLGSEWRDKAECLVDNAPETPDVTFDVVRRIVPHLWTSIIRSSGLSRYKIFFCYFRDIHVT